MIATSDRESRFGQALRTTVRQALASCSTEAEIVQVLYAHLNPVLGYHVINLQVLAPEGRLSACIVDRGVLQDAQQLPITESPFACHYEDPRPHVGTLPLGAHVAPTAQVESTRPQDTYIWIPIRRQSQVIGSVAYQRPANQRETTAEEICFLQDLNEQLSLSTAWAALRGGLHSALMSCATEADIVQVLYVELHPRFGYDIISLQVLEREGRLHSLVVDSGVLQDVHHFLLTESRHANNYLDPKPTVDHVEPDRGFTRSRGPGATRRPQTLIWIPLFNGGQVIGSIVYQLYAKREVPAEELAILGHVHERLGVLVSNAYLNELTRNQALRLSALNTIARSLSVTHDEAGVLSALYSTLSALISVDSLDLLIREDGEDGQLRILRSRQGREPVSFPVSRRARDLAPLRTVLETGRPTLTAGAHNSARGSAATVPILEGGRIRGAFSIHSDNPGAYEESTLAFLEQVADEVSLALRNAASYAALEAQQRRLEVANAVARRLTSSLDRWSIVQTLREELSRHLEFDLFSLATVQESTGGPLVEAYLYDSEEERQLDPIPLADAGPVREAFESGQPVLIRRSRQARSLEGFSQDGDGSLLAEGAATSLMRRRERSRVATRSLVWVPVRQADRVRAVLTLQANRPEAFTEWHVHLLEDVAAQVGLALSTADHFSVAQGERRRLEALHVLEMGAAGASDERQVAQAFFTAVIGSVQASYLAVLYLNFEGQLTGYATEPGGAQTPLPPKPPERTHYFKRLLEKGRSIVETTPPELREPRPGFGWQIGASRMPAQVAWVPLIQDGRVIGALSAQRHYDTPFSQDDVDLLERAAPAVSIALRSVRLNRVSELALTHSLRIQEVASLAGHDLDSVVASIAEQARTMLSAAGTVCWAFDAEDRVTAWAKTGKVVPRRILGWAGRSPARPWRQPPRQVVSGTDGILDWSVMPLWYADRLVGALGCTRLSAGIEPTPEAVTDFARHAAIAIENARLAAEARGRIRTLEAVAAFADLDITRPARARTQMGRLVAKALSSSQGALWLLEGEHMVRYSAGRRARRLPAARLSHLLAAGRSRLSSRDLGRALLERVSPNGSEVFAVPIVVTGRVVGMLTADASGASLVETRRLMAVLAGQAALVLGRLQMVAELDSQARMMSNILHHSPVGVVLEDAAGKIIYANPEVERIYGVSAESVTGMRAAQLLEQATATVGSGEEQPAAPLELRLSRGTVVHVRRVPIPGTEEQPARILTLHEDVTQEHVVLEAKDLMLRAIGHEVRSPAAAMRSTIAGLLQWGELMDPDRRRGLVEEAYEQSDRLLSLVENQLIIAKLETRHFEPEKIQVALEDVLRLVIGVLRNKYGQRVDAISIELAPDLPDVVCEPSHLDQVLTNLIGNALEYTPAHRISVSARPVEDSLEVTVADDGGGLPAERLQTLFQKTGPAGRNRARGGLGLGLYLCRLVVERSFSGRIWLDSTGPSGTVFKFTVPIPRASRPAVPAPAPGALQPAPAVR